VRAVDRVDTDVRACNLAASHIEGGSLAEGVREYGVVSERDEERGAVVKTV
jgi:hypothetical protein